MNMDLSSDGESSESSGERYFVSSDKIESESPFFKRSASNLEKSSFIPKNNDENIGTDDSDDDFDCVDDEKLDTAALLVEVMKNLEKANETNSSLAVDAANLHENNCEEKSSPKGEKNKCVLSQEINDLLLRGETVGTNSVGKNSVGTNSVGTNSVGKTSVGTNSVGTNSVGRTSVEVADDEEDVAPSRPADYTIPKEGVSVFLPGEALTFKRRKKRDDIEDALRRRMNQRLRSNQIYVHKAGLLCWLAHGFCLNKQINDPEVLSTALSLVPSNSYPDGRADLKYLEGFTKWFKNFVKLEFRATEEDVGRETLLARLREKKARNHRELVLLFAATLRAIGLTCRIIISLCPPALKPRTDQLFKNPKTAKNTTKEDDGGTRRENVSKVKKELANVGKKASEKNARTKKRSSGESSDGKIVPENSSEIDKNDKINAKKRAASVLAKFANTTKKKTIKTIVELKDNTVKNDKPEAETREIESPPRLRKLRSRIVREKSDDKKDDKTIKIDDNPSKSENNIVKKTRGTKNEIPSTSAHNDPETEEKKTFARKKTRKTSGNLEDWTDSDSDGEFETKPAPKMRKVADSVKKKEDKRADAARKSIDRRVLSSDEESAEIIDAKDAQNIWIEVYVETEESWISVSIIDEKIHCVDELYKKAPKPVLYVVAWNSAGTLKDVTRRYCPHWLTVTRKQRVDEKWWSETLNPWKERNTGLSKAEDEMLLQRELEQPLPKTVGECKGHPLYALARHLLKFEALYPPECVPLGHLRTGEAIYSRHCVHTLYSRETWLKKARVVKPAQTAYKIVKAMPKYDKLSGIKLKDQPLELFGKWQTMQYVPPEAKNGIVPRNEYGNVDLFKQCMLPKGTVHINLPGLNRVARKLNIDCSPAVVGFNFGARGALPAFEGFVVCEEFEDTLREAWESEQVEAIKRAEEKREKRIYDNWKKLIKGLFIRERLAARYDFNNDDEKETNDKKSSSKRSKQTVPDTKKKNVKRAKS